MTVRLIDHTENPVETIVMSGLVCYSGKSFEELEIKAKDKATQEKMVKQLIESGHGSPLEHASFTFFIDNVSRVMTHQLVRHRLASFDQRSQRYTRQKDGEYIIPESVMNNLDISKEYAEFIDKANFMYKSLIEKGIPKEDARMILPQSSKTTIIMTMNLREIRHFLSLRLCERAQWEIRNVAKEIFKLIYERWPLLLYKCGTMCMTGTCTEHNKTKNCPMTIEKIIG